MLVENQMSRAKTPVVDSRQRLRRLLLSLMSEVVLSVITLISLTIPCLVFGLFLVYVVVTEFMNIIKSCFYWTRKIGGASLHAMQITYCKRCIYKTCGLYDTQLREAHGRWKVRTPVVLVIPRRQPCSVHSRRSACQNMWPSVKLVHAMPWTSTQNNI